MPKTVTVRDDAVVLESDEAQVGVLDRALSGYATGLQAARDLGVISHETFGGKADRARAVQYLVWEAKDKFEVDKRHLTTPQPGGRHKRADMTFGVEPFTHHGLSEATSELSPLRSDSLAKCSVAGGLRRAQPFGACFRTPRTKLSARL